MKQKVLFLLLLMGLSMSVFAQATQYNSAVVIETNFNINNNYPCPVANIDKTYSIAAVKMNATTTAFCLINHDDFVNPPSPGTPVSPPNITADAASYSFTSPITGFTVNDLAIVDNYAFFCGTINSNEAIYGYFDYNDFAAFGGSWVNVFVYSLINGSLNAPQTLKKMVAYKDGSYYKVVAIGDEDILPHYCTSKIVEITDATGSPLCEVADMPNASYGSTPIKVFLDDIVLTDNYVAVIGHDANANSMCSGIPGTGYPWISFGYRSNVVNEICNMGLNPNYYLSNPNEANDAVIGVSLDEDFIAISYVYFDEITLKTFTRFRVIDIPSLNNIYSQQFKIIDKENPVEMIYLNNINRVELMQPVIHPSDYIQLYPLATANYTASMLTPNSHEFKSLDRIMDGGAWRFISTRNTEIYLQDRTANLAGVPIPCPKEYILDVDCINNLPLDQSACPINYGTNILTPLGILPIVFQFNYPTCSVNCFSYE